MRFYKFEGKCHTVCELLNKLFPTDRFRLTYVENRSRRMEVGSEVYTIVLTNRGRNARNVCINIVHTAHSVEKVSRRGQKVLERLAMCALSRPSHICRFRQVVSYNFEISILSTKLTCFTPFSNENNARMLLLCASFFSSLELYTLNSKGMSPKVLTHHLQSSSI